MKRFNGKIYFAGPLFSMADRLFNRQLAKVLSKYGYNILLPQDFDVNENMQDLRNPADIARVDINALEECDIVIANCDGSDVDSGTAFELGYAVARHKITVIWRTDSREFAKGEKCNAMLYLADNYVFCDSGISIEQLGKLLHEAIKIIKGKRNSVYIK